jgi:tRNA modification GTPase
MDLIDSETPLAARNAAMQLHGAVTEKTEAVYSLLLGLLVHFQAVVDYPEEGVEPLEAEEMAQSLSQAEAQLDRLTRSFARRSLLKEGIPCAILGKPNVGKSSLLNALLGEERAIVTDEAGTTRDTLEEKLTVGGLLLRLTDTAGLRDTSSAAEAEGVRRAEAAAEGAGLVLAVFDASRPPEPEDRRVIAAAGAAPLSVAVLNKADLPPVWDAGALEGRFNAVLSLSAKTGEGLEELEEAVTKLLDPEENLPMGESLTNERQYDAILRAQVAIGRAAAALKEGFTPDAVLTDAEEALAALGELSGRTIREDIVEAVFSRFCVGK